MSSYSYSRELRLLAPENFSFVFQQPVRSSRPELTILARKNDVGFPRLGLTIAKKNVKRAHDRNRIKRVCREYFRLNQHTLPSMDFIIVAKKGITALDNSTLFSILETLCNRHRRLAQKS